MTNISEFRGKSNDELKEKALELKKELFNLRFQMASGEQPGTARLRSARRDIARLKTLLNEPKDAARPVKKEKAPKAPKAAKTAEPKAAKETKEPKAKKAATKKKASGE